MIKIRVKEVNVIKERNGWKGARYQDEGGSQQASGVFNITHESEHLNPDYNLEILENNTISKQGLLLCGKLIPKHPSLPEFSLRWDEKSDALDVDMHGDSKHKNDWKYSRNGYTGHHAAKLKREGRHFQVSIEMPTMKVFYGIISFNLARDVSAAVKTGLNASAEISVDRKSKS
jgi:hypothetical protein